MYDVIGRDKLTDLVKDVNDKIEEGWKVQGGVSSITRQVVGGYWFFQAMTKNEE